MSNKDRICVGLFHRDKHSLGTRTDFAKYHWTILIRPKAVKGIATSALYDATDAIQLDSDLNANMNWRFRSREPVNPFEDGRFLVAIDIGKLPKKVTKNNIKDLLARVPLPQKDQTPEQNCVTWTQRAISELQQGAGLIDDKISVQEIMEVSFQQADSVMKHGVPSKGVERFKDLKALCHG